MDPETEKRIASVLLEEAVHLRQRADREGVHVYLHKPQGRCRPNSRFLTATVLGVQQSNRAVEVNEMWRAREKELELSKNRKPEDYSHGKNNRRRSGESQRHNSGRSSSLLRHGDSSVSSSSAVGRELPEEDGSLRDEDVEEFLRSKSKRGRGSIGSRMDEPGPYLPPSAASADSRVNEDWEKRVFGPEKPPHLKYHRLTDSSSLPSSDDEGQMRKRKKKHRHSNKSTSKCRRSKKSKQEGQAGR